MKQILFFILGIVIGLTALPSFAQTADKATLIVYRPKRFAGSAIKAKLAINDEIYRISNNSQKTILLEPKRYRFQMKGMGGSKKEVFEKNLEAGKTYYIKIMPIQRFFLLFYHQIMDEDQAKVELMEIPK